MLSLKHELVGQGAGKKVQSGERSAGEGAEEGGSLGVEGVADERSQFPVFDTVGVVDPAGGTEGRQLRGLLRRSST
jgi:hypothetical protein